jgi:hypothetical protein
LRNPRDERAGANKRRNTGAGRRDVKIVGVAVFRQARSECGAAVLPQYEQARRKGQRAPPVRRPPRPAPSRARVSRPAAGSKAYAKCLAGLDNLEEVSGRVPKHLCARRRIHQGLPRRVSRLLFAGVASLPVCRCCRASCVCARARKHTHTHTHTHSHAHTHTHERLDASSQRGEDPTLTCWFHHRPARFLSR